MLCMLSSETVLKLLVPTHMGEGVFPCGLRYPARIFSGEPELVPSLVFKRRLFSSSVPGSEDRPDFRPPTL